MLEYQFRRFGLISDWVFPNSRDHSAPTNSVAAVWGKIREIAQLENFWFHDLRRTYATFQLLATGNLKLVQMNLHHAAISTTANAYAHIDTDERLRVASQAGCRKLLDAGGIPLNDILGITPGETTATSGAAVATSGTSSM